MTAWLGQNPFRGGNPDESIVSTSAPWNSAPANVAVYQNGVYDVQNSCPSDFAWHRMGKIIPTNCKTYNDIILTVSGVSSTGSYLGGQRTGFNPIIYEQDYPIQVSCGATPNGVWRIPFAGIESTLKAPVWRLWSDETFPISYTTFYPDPHNPNLNPDGNVPPSGPHTGSADACFDFYLIAEPHNDQNAGQGLSLLITARIKKLYTGRWTTHFVLRGYDWDAVALPSFFSGGGKTVPPSVLNPLYAAVVAALQSASQPTSLVDPFFTSAVHGLQTLPSLQFAVDNALILAAGFPPPIVPAPWLATVQPAVDAAFATAQDALESALPQNGTFGNSWQNGQTAMPFDSIGALPTNIAAVGGTATAESAAPITDPTRINCLTTEDADGNTIPLPPPVICDPNADCFGWQPNCEVEVSATEAECYQAQNSLGQMVPISGSYEYVHTLGQWTWGLVDNTQTAFKRYLAFVQVNVCTGDWQHFGVSFGNFLAPDPTVNPTDPPDGSFFADPSAAPFTCEAGFYLAPGLQCLADFQSSSSSSTSSSSESYAHTYEDSVSSSSETETALSTSSSHSSESSESRSSQSSQSQPPFGAHGGAITGVFTSPLAPSPCGEGASVTITFGGG